MVCTFGELEVTLVVKFFNATVFTLSLDLQRVSLSGVVLWADLPTLNITGAGQRECYPAISIAKPHTGSEIIKALC